MYKNLNLEPKWGREDLAKIEKLLFNLINVMDSQFKDDSVSAGVKFEAACQGGVYKEFCQLLDKLGNYWPEFRCQ